MKSLLALIAGGALLIGTAAAQQYPSDQYPPQQYPDQNQPYPQQQYPQQYPDQQQQYPDQRYPQQRYPQQTYPQRSSQYPNSAEYGNNVIPAGTQLQIRTNENIVADSQSTGRTYAAEISQDVIGPNGQVMIPRNSPAQLSVQNVSSGTMGVGNNQVALALQSVNVNGRRYNVISNTSTQSGDRGIGANKRTAVMTGGGAVLGTVIGAIAGGGKGAVIGGVLGAGGGAAAQVLTRGKEVKVPAESVLTFRLDQPLMLQ